MAVNPPPPLPLTLCSWSIHECVKPGDLLEAKLSTLIPSLQQTACLFCRLRRATELKWTTGWYINDCSLLRRAGSLWEHCMSNTCKHQPNNWIAPHPHTYQHSNSSSSSSWRQKRDSVTETAPRGLPSPYCQAHRICPTYQNNGWTQENCKNSPSTILPVLDLHSACSLRHCVHIPDPKSHPTILKHKPSLLIFWVNYLLLLVKSEAN